jgi:hypothetical protein
VLSAAAGLRMVASESSSRSTVEIPLECENARPHREILDRRGLSPALDVASTSPSSSSVLGLKVFAVAPGAGAERKRNKNLTKW